MDIATALKLRIATLVRRTAATLNGWAQSLEHSQHSEAVDPAIEARRLPVEKQVLLLAGLGCALLILIGMTYGARALFSMSTAPNIATTNPGTFQPSPQQLASLVIKPTRAFSFRPQIVTDGSIAVNDDRSTPVYSPYSGRVTRLIAKLGDVVQKGAPLMAVEAAEYNQAQNDLITATSGLNSARAQLNLATTNEHRQHALYDAKGAALKDWQQSQSDLATAQGNFHTAEITLTSVRNRLRIFGMTDKEIDALERTPTLLKANAEVLVTAPIAGTVIQRQVGQGQFIQSGAASPVYTIGDLSTVWFIANVREEDAPAMRVGDPVELRVLAMPGRTFRAKISYVASAIDPNTRRLPVRADVDNSAGLLKPQMFASITIVTGAGETKPAVPESAIIYEGDQARVWVQYRDGSLGLRLIRVGRTQGDLVEILSGIKAGEMIVTSGAIFIDRAASGS